MGGTEEDFMLARLAGEFPGFEVWVGVTGVLYARRPGTSPPVVFRATTADGLRRKVAAYENGKRTAPGGG
jgi:hypothetical protein